MTHVVILINVTFLYYIMKHAEIRKFCIIQWANISKKCKMLPDHGWTKEAFKLQWNLIWHSVNENFIDMVLDSTLHLIFKKTLLLSLDVTSTAIWKKYYQLFKAHVPDALKGQRSEYQGLEQGRFYWSRKCQQRRWETWWCLKPILREPRFRASFMSREERMGRTGGGLQGRAGKSPHLLVRSCFLTTGDLSPVLRFLSVFDEQSWLCFAFPTYWGGSFCRICQSAHLQ